MSDDAEAAKAKAERARRNLKRRARAAEFEAYEDAELRRGEGHGRLTPDSERGRAPPARDGGSNPAGPSGTGRRKGLPSQRGK